MTSAALVDIATRPDLDRLLRVFYEAALADPMLRPVFVDVARLDLEHHLPIIGDFWETVLFQAGLYKRNALQLHQDLNEQVPLTPHHFQRWLLLWGQTIDHLFSGPVADRAKDQAGRIGDSMQRRIGGQTGSQLLADLAVVRVTKSER